MPKCVESPAPAKARRLARTLSQAQDDEKSAWRRHAWIIPLILSVLLLDGWVITWGDGRFFDHERFCGFYDAQARALLHGRLDVPREAIGFEAFVRDGKYYGYFGIGPALLRLPLVAMFPAMDGRWSRLFMLGACLGNMVLAYRLVLRMLESDSPKSASHRIVAALIVVLAGAGSTTLFLASRSYTYHEAIMWGALWSLLCVERLIAYLDKPTMGRLIVMCLSAFMAFNTRPTAGAGALLALGGVAVVLARHLRRSEDEDCGRVRPPYGIAQPRAFSPSPGTPGEGRGEGKPRHLLITIAAISLTLGVYFAVNLGRFRTFDGVPLRYYELYIQNPQRAVAAGGKQLHIENLPTGIATYFSFAGVELHRTFPWIFLGRRPCIIGNPSIDQVEPFCGMPIAMPGLFFLALAGTAPLIGRKSIVLRHFAFAAACAIAGGMLVTMTVGITHRYLHDFFPFLVLAAAAGCGRLLRARASNDVGSASADAMTAVGRSASRQAIASAEADPTTALISQVSVSHVRRNVCILVLLTLFSVYINFAFAMQFQRAIVWGVPKGKQLQWFQFRSTVDRFFRSGATTFNDADAADPTIAGE